MPNIWPISDLRNNSNEISEFCRGTREPVFITKNGVGDMVVMKNMRDSRGRLNCMRLLLEQYTSTYAVATIFDAKSRIQARPRSSIRRTGNKPTQINKKECMEISNDSLSGTYTNEPLQCTFLRFGGILL